MTEKKKFLDNLLLHIIIFIMSGFFLIIFRDNNLLLTLLLIVISIILIKIHFRKEDIYFYIAAAILGSLSEIIAISYGIWNYRNPSFLGIPLWLPFGWGAFVILIRNISLNFMNGTK